MNLSATFQSLTKERSQASRPGPRKNNSLVPTYTWPEGTIDSGPVSPQIRSAPEILAFTVGDPLHSSNVAVARGTTLHRITDEGDKQLANVALGEVRIIHWSSKEGIALEGIVTFPADYQPGRKYPFMVRPHGGPEMNDSLLFYPYIRLLAGLGYVVLQPQYRGSTGYGTDFHECDLSALRRSCLSRCR